MTTPPYEINATDVAQYVKYNSCDRRARLRFNDAAKSTVKFAGQAFNPIDPVLQKEGDKREKEWANKLESQGFSNLNKNHPNRLTRRQKQGETEEWFEWPDFIDLLQSLSVGEEVFAREVKVVGYIGKFKIKGRIDFAILRWEGRKPILRIVETKGSRKERTSHRIQIVIYQYLIEQLVSKPIREKQKGEEIIVDDIEYAVGRIDEATNQIQDLITLLPADLRREREDVGELLGLGGHFQTVIETKESNIDKLDYQLEPKCDQCRFDVHCFAESSRNRRLELLGLGPSAIEEMKDAGPSGQGVEDIDDLANLDLTTQTAEDIRSAENVRRDLNKLKQDAEARRQNLPHSSNKNGFEVTSVLTDSDSILPQHTIDGESLIRVYLDVSYDYVEDRIVSLAAHVTENTGWVFTTDWEQLQNSGPDELNFQPDVELKESERQTGTSPKHWKKREYSKHNLDPIVEYVPTPWTSNEAVNDGMESTMVSNFIQKLKRQINNIHPSDEGFIHFYVWSESEMEHLVDACARGQPTLLSDLRELLGCREPTEQLIYSPLRGEIDRRYSLGWTGRGLIVATDLNWFGQRYHWDREVNGRRVKLDDVFTQNLFDFKSERHLDQNNDWTNQNNPKAQGFEFELRSRFFDSLPVPYIHALWGTLSTPSSLPPAKFRLREALTRFNQVTHDTLEAYLGARTHALRWTEERCSKQDSDVRKEKVNLPKLPSRTRSVNTTSRVARDFLLLDQHSKRSEWFAEHLEPLNHQVSLGDALVISNGYSPKNERDKLVLQMDFSSTDISKNEFRARTGLEEGDFVHLCVAPNDLSKGPTLKQLTNTAYVGPIETINWTNGFIEMNVIPTYVKSSFLMDSKSVNKSTTNLVDQLPNNPNYPNRNTQFMLVDSVSDYTSKSVFERLGEQSGKHAYNWFDPTNSGLPDGPQVHSYDLTAAKWATKEYQLSGSKTLAESQSAAVVDGLDSKVQLLLGPPGTGKTTTTSLAVLQRIVHRQHICNDISHVVLVVGSSHRAVDELLNGIAEHSDQFQKHISQYPGPDLPDISCVKLVSKSSDSSQTAGLSSAVDCEEKEGNHWNFKPILDDGVLVLGGTTNSIIKEIEDLSDNSSDIWSGSGSPYLADELIVDEASMMSYPHFLATSSLVKPDARIMVTGDHRQLSPIVARDWEMETRPSIEKYEPQRSAFDVVRSIKSTHNLTNQKIQTSELDYTFRLEQILQSLIRPLYKKLDDVELKGNSTSVPFKPSGNKPPFESVWEPESGLFLVRHDEDQSRVSNDTELEIVEEILSAMPSTVPPDSVSLITPHTAQRAQLKQLTNNYSSAINVADTVERLQGGESQTVIVSATASDKTAISNNEEFLLNLNRANVAFSRAQKRLIVICSETLMNYIPPEMEEYRSSMLWKTLRRICSDPVGTVPLTNAEAEVLAPDESVEEVKDVLQNP